MLWISCLTMSSVICSIIHGCFQSRDSHPWSPENLLSSLWRYCSLHILNALTFWNPCLWDVRLYASKPHLMPFLTHHIVWFSRKKNIFYLIFLLFNWKLTLRCDIFLFIFQEFCLFSGYSVKNSILSLKNVSPVHFIHFFKTAASSSVPPTPCLCVLGLESSLWSFLCFSPCHRPFILEPLLRCAGFYKSLYPRQRHQSPDRGSVHRHSMPLSSFSGGGGGSGGMVVWIRRIPMGS